MIIRVRKADGSLELFDENKVLKTCFKLGLEPKNARRVLEKVKKRIYDTIPTKEIYKLITAYAQKFNPILRFRLGLREAIAKLRPKPDFELFVERTLQEIGYKTERNVIVPGKCVEHEVDVIAEKNDEKEFVEIKHHVNPHARIGLNVILASWAAYQDVLDGYKRGLHNFGFKELLIISNSKISDHARRFCECKGIKFLGWKFPKKSLDYLIESKKLYPITLIKGLTEFEINEFSKIGLILLKDIPSKKPKLLKIGKKRYEEILKIGKELLKI